tara:strand:+ start:651 stop:1166 length:516 start_codon:yes stop_codon:yes gene_type:complete
MALKGDRTMSELATQLDLHPNQIKQWKDQLRDGVANVFDDKPKAPREPEVDVTSLHGKIGQLALENDLLEGALDNAGLLPSARKWTDPNHRLSLTWQAGLLGISRGSLYYAPRPTSDTDLKLMRRIDELHIEYPFAGSRMMRGPAQARRLHGRAVACGNLYENHGDRGALS